MKNSITDKDYGFKELLEVFDEMEEGVVVEVGVPATAEEYEDGTNLALVASVNEFGSDDGRIPERSYLRSTMDENEGHFSKLFEKVLVRVVQGKLTPEQALDVIGMDAASKVRRKIDNLKDPPNAEATIKMKSSSNPLVDTGQLKQSIIHRVVKE